MTQGSRHSKCLSKDLSKRPDFAHDETFASRARLAAPQSPYAGVQEETQQQLDILKASDVPLSDAARCASWCAPTSAPLMMRCTKCRNSPQALAPNKAPRTSATLALNHAALAIMHATRRSFMPSQRPARVNSHVSMLQTLAQFTQLAQHTLALTDAS